MMLQQEDILSSRGAVKTALVTVEKDCFQKLQLQTFN
jgi:hypothetical protein